MISQGKSTLMTDWLADWLLLLITLYTPRANTILYIYSWLLKIETNYINKLILICVYMRSCEWVLSLSCCLLSTSSISITITVIIIISSVFHKIFETLLCVMGQEMVKSSLDRRHYKQHLVQWHLVAYC